MMAKYEIEIDGIPDDFEPVRFGIPKAGEEVVSRYGGILKTEYEWNEPRLIVRKKQTVRPWTFETAPHSVKVQSKTTDARGFLVLGRDSGIWLMKSSDGTLFRFENLLNHYVQLDGSPCGEVV